MCHGLKGFLLVLISLLNSCHESQSIKPHHAQRSTMTLTFILFSFFLFFADLLHVQEVASAEVKTRVILFAN